MIPNRSIKKMSASPRHPRPATAGFTLVEILVVIVIIGILAGIAIPAVTRAITRARETEARMEISALADAVEQYQQKYGDYPPDGSSLVVLQRHMRKLFGNMASPDSELLFSLTHPDGMNFSGVAMDRAEALVFFLGGFSEDILHPITGEGGPLTLIDPANAGSTALADYQYNGTRDNAFFNFVPERLTFALRSGRYVSTDEDDYGYNDVPHGGIDLLPAYRSTRAQTPIVYFDSRTYGQIGTDGSGAPVYNGYLNGTEFGGVRPYKTAINAQPPQSGSYGNQQAAFEAIDFQNRDTFQIVSPGGDGVYAALINTSTGLPVHFITNSAGPLEAGDAVAPVAAATSLTGLKDIDGRQVSGYQDQDYESEITINGQLDNVTNFVSSTLESELE